MIRVYNYKDKEKNITTQVNYMLTRSINMFEYTNLPDTLPAVEIEKLLQTVGYGFIGEHEEDVYVFKGTLGGKQDIYGNYTNYIVNNPYLNINDSFDVREDGVLIKNDDLMLGMLPIYERYIYMMVENDISMVMNSFNNRIQSIISAGDDSTKASAELYVKKIIDGELSIIGENRLFDGVKTNSSQAHANVNITNLIEYHQYLKASLYNEIGLNANFNMKRERLTSSETNLNTDGLYPFIDDMLECRREAIEKVNDMFHLDIEVDFAGVWKERNLQPDYAAKVDFSDDEVLYLKTEPEVEDVDNSEVIEPTEVIDMLNEVEDVIEEVIEEVQEIE